MDLNIFRVTRFSHLFLPSVPNASPRSKELAFRLRLGMKPVVMSLKAILITLITYPLRFLGICFATSTSMLSRHCLLAKNSSCFLIILAGRQTLDEFGRETIGFRT